MTTGASTVARRGFWVSADPHSSTVEELRRALLEFKETSNRKWITQHHGSKTLAAAHVIPKDTMTKA